MLTQHDASLLVTEYNRLITMEARVKGESAMLHQPVELVTAYQNLVTAARTGGWMPIETAPQDGTHILLRHGNIQHTGYCSDPQCPWRVLAAGLPVMLPEPTHWRELEITEKETAQCQK